jgi:hypothetical protein
MYQPTIKYDNNQTQDNEYPLQSFLKRLFMDTSSQHRQPFSDNQQVREDQPQQSADLSPVLLDLLQFPLNRNK